jgi:hypothetical protein
LAWTRSGVTHLAAPEQEDILTPTQIGQRLGGLSAIKVNKLLVERGFQEKAEDGTWALTEKGKPFGRWDITNKKHSDGTSVRQLRWIASIEAALQGTA